jgi:flagellar operon protein
VRVDQVQITDHGSRITDHGSRGTAPRPERAFSDVLAEQLERTPLRFSGHAQKRLEQRHIRLDETVLDRLRAGVERADGKGSRTALILVEGTAFVVSVENQTVITVADDEALKEQVFTNIDSVVIT